MPPKRKSRVYARNQGGTVRYYGDFRDFRDVGGRQEPLVAEGEKRATTDADVAGELAAQRLKELEAKRRGVTLVGKRRQESLAAFAAHHLKKKAAGVRRGTITGDWVENAEPHLDVAIKFFGAGRILDAVTVEDVQSYAEHLADLPSRRTAKHLSPGTQRKYLNSLSNLYRRASAEGVVPPGYNPVGAMMEKPARRVEAAWLEVPHAALFLEAARTFVPGRADLTFPAIYELIATFLLTGERMSEVFGLDFADVRFERKIVTIRPFERRRLKTENAFRVVPLWPQLEEVLRPYIGSRQSGLLFPSPRTGEMVTDIRKVLDAIGERIGFAPGEVRTKAFRHTYCAARLQTVDRGAPVSPFTVGRELGHGGDALAKRIYGHLGSFRHRSEAVEYRPENHLAEMGELFADLRAGEMVSLPR